METLYEAKGHLLANHFLQGLSLAMMRTFYETAPLPEKKVFTKRQPTADWLRP